MASLTQILEITTAIESGSIEKATKAQLSRYIGWLSEPNSRRHFPEELYSQVFEVVRLNMLRVMIEAFEERSRVMQNWMLLFAVIAVIAPFVQPLIMARSTSATTPSPTPAASASASPHLLQAASAPIQAPPPSSGPAKATQASSLPASAGHK